MFSFLSFLLTDVLVPSLVELAVMREAALHGVEAVVVAWLGSHEALAVRAVHHLREAPTTLLCWLHLANKISKC